MSNSQRASMTSSPLFISVAESIVIFRPISQLGCLRHRCNVTPANSSALQPRNGPPEAVSNSRLIAEGCSPARHWAIALCSLSTGTTATRFFLANSITSAPAATNVSLLAMAKVFPALMQAIEGASPANPTSALRTTSVPSNDAADSSAAIP